ncbi:hypothetical protein HHK36_008244 [Tetracentron sinense]|uniref:Uncharacterized protein n=1 Tax=Tetracentron sinense TaxID=13715 RepID=A0A834ZF10_TETSI|nr:hypothetical protein HHK36_008244 [Tetracentron sinense]
MENYYKLSNNTATRESFSYTAPVLAPNSPLYGRTSSSSNLTNQQIQVPINALHLQPGECFQAEAPPIVKTEASSSQSVQQFHYPHQRHEQGGNENSNEAEAIKAKIIAHPQYSNLLEAYMDCKKVGAPSEVVDRLAEIRQEFAARQRSSVIYRDASKDPELDQFMVIDRVSFFLLDEKCEGIGSSEEDQDNSGGETELTEIDPRAEDRELKNHLLKKYSGYLGSLKQELSKKRKKGKLPKEARQKLLTWWELHYKWPYPSETEKVALAESTGLDQKQINNWFINQRKRHWKPSEDMQFMVMDGLHPQSGSLYMEGHFMGDGSYRLGP